MQALVVGTAVGTTPSPLGCGETWEQKECPPTPCPPSQMTSVTLLGIFPAPNSLPLC